MSSQIFSEVNDKEKINLRNQPLFQLLNNMLRLKKLEGDAKEMKDRIVNALAFSLKPEGLILEDTYFKEIYLTGTIVEKQQIYKLEEDEEPLVMEIPFLPPLKNHEYTLILDLDETLIKCEEDQNGNTVIHQRPGLQEFLEEMSKYFELVIFTAGLKDYAEGVVEEIDPKKLIIHKLSRESTILIDKFYVKDLSLLGRDLSKTIILDNCAENFQFQPENGIFIKTWTGEQDDYALKEVAALLKQIVKKKISDVRKGLLKFRDQMIRLLSIGIQDPHTNLVSDDGQSTKNSVKPQFDG